MKNTVFFDIDTQYDFMNKAGSLYVKGAQSLIANIARLIRFAQKKDILVLSSVDAHSKKDPEFRQFPVHCVGGSRGVRKIPQTRLKKSEVINEKRIPAKTLTNLIKHKQQIILKKKTFDVFSNPNTRQVLRLAQAKKAYVFGVALDYCVKAAGMGLLSLGINTYLVIDATKPVSPEGGRRALMELKDKGIRTITTKRLTISH